MNLVPKNLRSNYKIILFGFLERANLFYAVITPAIKFYLDKPVSLIGLFFLVHEFCKSILDYFSYFLLKKIGFFKLILLGIAIRAIGFAVWLKPNGVTTIIISAFLCGAGKAFSVSKYEDFLSQIPQEKFSDKFINIISYKLIFNNLGAFTSGIVSGIIYNKFGTKSLFCAASIISIIHGIVFALNWHQYSYIFPQKKKVRKNKIGFLKFSDVSFIHYIIICFSFFSFTNLYKISLVNQEFGIKALTTIYSFSHLLSCILSIVFTKTKIHSKIFNIASYALILSSIFAYILCAKYAPWLMIAYLCAFYTFKAYSLANIKARYRNSNEKSYKISASESIISILNTVLYALIYFS